MKFQLKKQFNEMNHVGFGSNVSTLNGVIAMSVGSVLGYGVFADLKTLKIMQRLGSERKKIKGRFGHPYGSDRVSRGRISTCDNFRIEGDHLRYDWHAYEPARISPAFSYDPIQYIMEIARTDPSSIGEMEERYPQTSLETLRIRIN